MLPRLWTLMLSVGWDQAETPLGFDALIYLLLSRIELLTFIILQLSHSFKCYSAFERKYIYTYIYIYIFAFCSLSLESYNEPNSL